jgi:hypothetical protein
MELRSGRPVGFRFPKASRGVRVAVIEDPEVTDSAEVVTSL